MDIIEIEPDIVEIGDLNIPEIKLASISDDEDNDIIGSKPSINFGAGIELLMNDKNKEQKKQSSNIEIEDITKLENELNELNDFNDLTNDNKVINEKPMKKNSSGMFGGLFSKKEDGENIKSVNEIKKDDNYPGLGKST